MKKLVARTRLGRVFALAAAFAALTGAPAGAAIMWQVGCIAWNEGTGCSVMQSCWYDTVSGQWGCRSTLAQ